MAQSVTRNAGRFPALHHRDFRIFWLGQVVSGVGTQFTTVAMAWQIYELTNSPLHIGLLGLAQAIPQMGLLLFGGLLADATDRRRLMIATQAGQLLVSATLAALTVTGKVSPLALYAASMLLALCNSLETPARLSLTSNLVPHSDLANALALSNTQRQVSMIAGPSMAGIALAVAGPALCYAADAVSWFAMIAALMALKTRPQLPATRGAISLGSLREGVDFVRTHPVIFLLMGLDFGATFLASTRALLPIFARDILYVGPQGLGILYSATAIGSLVAGGTISLLSRITRPGLWVLVGVSIYGACTALFALSGIFWLSALMLAGTGLGNTISAVLRTTINQLSTPDELRGRVTSVNSVFTRGGPQLGQFQSGVVATFLGAEMAALLGGLATLTLVSTLAVARPAIARFEFGETRR